MNGTSRFLQALSRMSRVAIDSMVFIYHFEEDERYLLLTTALFDRMENGQLAAATSIITTAEIFSHQKVIKSEDLSAVYSHVFSMWPGLTIVSPDMDEAQLAGAIRVQYGLRLPDAFQVTAGLKFGAQALITNDERFRRVKQPKVMLFDDYL